MHAYNWMCGQVIRDDVETEMPACCVLCRLGLGDSFVVKQALARPLFGDSLRPSDWLREKYSPRIGYHVCVLYFDWLPCKNLDQ